MRGDLYTGWAMLSGNFLPSVNSNDDSSTLKEYESPACYGVSYTNMKYLSSGSIPTATAKTERNVTVSGNSYTWYYNRLWRISGNNLVYGPPEYDDYYLPHEVGSIRADATLIHFVPCLGNAMALITSSGTHIMPNAQNSEGTFSLGHFMQGLTTDTSSKVLEMGGVLYIANTSGVFSYDGNKITELTLPVRNSLGSFKDVELKADYKQRLVIGTSKFAIEADTGKLLDYGTSGFLFTSRTLQQPQFCNPFQVERVAFIYDRSDSSDLTLSWQSKANDEDWYTEEDIVIPNEEGFHSRYEVMISNPLTNVQKFAIRINAISSNFLIKEIQINVANYALRSITA